MTLADLGELGKIIREEIRRESERLAPARILPARFDDKTVLTLDDMCAVLGYEAKDRQKLRDACKRGEIPYRKVGQDYLFPKKLVIEFLSEPQQKRGEKKEKVSRDANGKAKNKLLELVY